MPDNNDDVNIKGLWPKLRKPGRSTEKVLEKIHALPKLEAKHSGSLRRLPEQDECCSKKHSSSWFRTDNTWTKLPILAQCVTEPFENRDGR